MTEDVNLSLDDQKFIDETIKVCQKMGEDAVLLLVGSRAAGFGSSWSDLDLWLLGNKSFLSVEERQKYKIDAGYFMKLTNCGIARIMKLTGYFTI